MYIASRLSSGTGRLSALIHTCTCYTRKHASKRWEILHGGTSLVPWIDQQHFTLLVGYVIATEDHMHCIHVESLAGPSSFTILTSFIETTKKPNPSGTVKSFRPVAIKTGLQTGGLDCPLWVLTAAEFALQWRDDIGSRAFETELIAWLRASPPLRWQWRDVIRSLFQATLRPTRWSPPGHLLPFSRQLSGIQIVVQAPLRSEDMLRLRYIGNRRFGTRSCVTVRPAVLPNQPICRSSMLCSRQKCKLS
jgi:hypothetical protein